MTSLRPPSMDRHCRTCRRALSTVTTALGPPMFLHSAELRGDTVDHPADPVPVTDLADPIIECDFCSAPDAAWVYRSANLDTEVRRVVNRVVGLRDYRRRHHAARTVWVDTEDGFTHRWGQTWGTCAGCAEVIERRDLYGLIGRVVEAMPPAMRRGKRLIRVRGEMHDTFSRMFTTLAPGRGRITPGHPLGIWDQPTAD